MKLSKRKLFGAFCAFMIGLPVLVQAMAPPQLGACVLIIEEEDALSSEELD